MKKQNSCLQISIARERFKSFDDSSFIQDFQSFSIEFPSQIWLSISSLKKRPAKCSTIVAERVLNVSGKLYTNVLHHTTRKNKHSHNPLMTFPILRTLKCAFPISAFFRPIPCDIPDTDKNVKKSCLTSNFIEFS